MTSYSALLPDPYSEPVVRDLTSRFFADAPVVFGTETAPPSDVTTTEPTPRPIVTIDMGTVEVDAEWLDAWRAQVLAHDPTGAPRFGNARAIRDNARTALTDNRAFIANTLPQIVSGADAILANANATPREKQLAQGVKALANQQRDTARMVNALIRLTLGSFDGTD